MSVARTWDRAFDSHADFYQHAYGQQITALKLMGRLGATLLEVRQPAGDWSDAPTPDLVFGYLISSTASVSCDQGAGRFNAILRRGDVVLTAPEAGSSLQMADPHKVLAFGVPYRSLYQRAENSELPQDGDFGRLHGGLLRDARLSGLLDALWRETEDGGAHGALFVDGLLLQLAGLLLRLRDGGASGAGRATGGLAPHHLRRIRAYLEEHLAEDVTLAELAALTGLSPHHLCRAFKQSTGLPPHRWRLARRIERAREMLERTELPVTEIAAAVGYDDPSQLSAVFRKALGISPSQYRRERRS